MVPKRTAVAALIALLINAALAFWFNGFHSVLNVCIAAATLIGICLLHKTALLEMLKTLPYYKGAAVLVLAALLTYLIPVNCLISRDALEQNTVEITAPGNKSEMSNGTEVWILEIRGDGVPMDLESIPLTDGWRLHNSAIISTPEIDKPSAPLTISSPSHNLEIDLLSHPWSGIVQIDGENIDLYDSGNKAYTHKSGNPFITVGRALCCYLSIYCLILCAIVLFGSKFVHNTYIYAAFYAAVNLLLWNRSALIDPAPSVMLFLGAFSVWAFCKTVQATRKGSIKPYLKPGAFALCVCISAYASFASFGYRLFLSGESIVIDSERVFILLLGVVWFVPVIIALLSMLESFGSAPAGSLRTPALAPWKAGALVSVVCFACLMIGLIGFYPGSFPPDVVSQITEAYGNTLSDNHPFGHTLLIRLLLSIYDSEAFLVATQLGLFSILLGRIAVIPFRYGIGLTKIVVFSAVFCLLPNQIMTNIGPIKDFPFTYALLWLTVLLAELVMDIQKISKVGFILQLVLSTFCIFAFRHNGIFAVVCVIMLLIALGVKYYRQVKWKPFLCAVSIVAVMAVWKGPVYQALNVSPNFTTPYVTMFCAVGSCVNKDLPFSEETTEILETVMPMEDWKNYYSRFLGHDLYMFNREGGMDLTNLSISDALSVYGEALERYPAVVIKDRLDGMNLLWDVTQPDESFNIKSFDYTRVNDAAQISIPGYEDGDVYISYTKIAQFYRNLTHFSFEGEREQDSLHDMLLWRPGAYIIMFMVLTLFWRKNRMGRMWWAAVPFLGNTLGMVLGLYHQSFRYVYYVQLLVIALIIFSIVLKRRQSIEESAATVE